MFGSIFTGVQWRNANGYIDINIQSALWTLFFYIRRMFYTNCDSNVKDAEVSFVSHFVLPYELRGCAEGLINYDHFLRLPMPRNGICVTQGGICAWQSRLIDFPEYRWAWFYSSSENFLWCPRFSFVEHETHNVTAFLPTHNYTYCWMICAGKNKTTT